jgi:hypothetical protein
MIYIDIVKQYFIMDSIKIYITNVSPSKINIEKMHEKFPCSTKSKMELCSLDFGIHVVEKDAIYRIEPSFNEKYNLIKNYGNGVFPNGFDLLIDENVEIRVPVVSQLPSDPIIINKTIYEFKQSFKSNLSLVVECIQQRCKTTLDENMVPVDFYFACAKNNFDIYNSFFQNEINEFLSMMN